MSATPTIAFVIPAYNAAAHIGDAVASAHTQSAPADEVIVVDDGSTDDTAGVAQRAGARVIRQANGGPAAARNTGIRAIKAEWVALLDADDIAYPHRLATQRPLLAEAGVAVVCSRASGNVTAILPGHIDFDVLWLRNAVRTSTVVLRKAAWDAIGGFDEDRRLLGAEDYNFWLRLAHAGWQFRSVPDVLVDYRPTATSITANIGACVNGELMNIRSIAEMFDLHADRLRQREYDVYRQYGFEFFHARDMASARGLLREAAKRQELDWAARLRLWATWLPFLPRRM